MADLDNAHNVAVFAARIARTAQDVKEQAEQIKRLTALLERTAEVRRVQKAYFREKNPGAKAAYLSESKALEEILDNDLVSLNIVKH